MRCSGTGCLQVSQEQFDKILGLINKGVEEGAKVEVGGKRYGVCHPHTCFESFALSCNRLNAHFNDRAPLLQPPSICF